MHPHCSVCEVPRVAGCLATRRLSADCLEAITCRVVEYYDACMTSHRRQGGLAPRWRKPGPGRRSPARLIAAGTAVVAMAGTGVAWALMPASPAGGSRSMSMASASRPVAAELMAAIRLADQSGTAKGMLPQADCLPDSMTMVTCMAPAPGITGVVLSTYPSLGALYSAYAAKVKSLNSGAIWQNYQDCGLTS